VLDVGMKHTIISVFSIVFPMIVSFILMIGFQLQSSILLRATLIYGFTVIFGFITTLILGQTYKTLPFVIWLEKYQALVGKTKTPLPRELYSEKVASAHFYLYLLFIITMILGLVLDQVFLIRIGSYLLLFVAILYNMNVFKMIFHKTKILKND
jgi:hypothetical protein